MFDRTKLRIKPLADRQNKQVIERDHVRPDTPPKQIPAGMPEIIDRVRAALRQRIVEVLRLARSAGGDDRDVYRLADRAEQGQVVAVPPGDQRAHRGGREVDTPERHHLARPTHGIGADADAEPLQAGEQMVAAALVVLASPVAMIIAGAGREQAMAVGLVIITMVFGLIPFTPPTMLMIGLWPLIMGVTMFVQMRLNPTPADPAQQIVFTWMPVIFTFMLGTFPAGLVIYWSWNNTLSVTQQYLIMKRHGVEVNLLGNIRSSLPFPKKTPTR